MARYIEVISLVTSDEGAVEVIEKEVEEVKAISLVTSEEETDNVSYDSDEEYWRERKRKCPFVLWESFEAVSAVDKCCVFFSLDFFFCARRVSLSLC